MEPRLITLKLVLDAIQVDNGIETVSERKRIQKALYLAQVAGADLGYRFGWYLMGPYSPALTRDYYALAEDLASGDVDYEEYTLREDWQERLNRVSQLLAHKPGDLEDVSWLELIASVDYLLRIRGLDETEVTDVLRDKKPRLVAHVAAGLEALKHADLIST